MIDSKQPKIPIKQPKIKLVNLSLNSGNRNADIEIEKNIADIIIGKVFFLDL